MEYEFYLEQIYQPNGIVKARILTADEAEKLGYEDDFVCKRTDGKLYVNGFGSKAAVRNYLSDMVGVVMV